MVDGRLPAQHPGPEPFLGEAFHLPVPCGRKPGIAVGNVRACRISLPGLQPDAQLTRNHPGRYPGISDPIVRRIVFRTQPSGVRAIVVGRGEHAAQFRYPRLRIDQPVLPSRHPLPLPHRTEQGEDPLRRRLIGLGVLVRYSCPFKICHNRLQNPLPASEGTPPVPFWH